MRWANLLPYRSFELNTSLTPGQAAEALDKNVGIQSLRSSFGFIDSRDAPYRGRVSATQFEIIRNGMLNSFQPILDGAFESAPFGTRVHVTLRAPGFALPWGALLVLAGTASAINSTWGSGTLREIMWAVAGGGLMLALWFAFVSGSFAYEAAKSQKFLRELFPAAPTLKQLGPYREVRPIR